jgi:hypothetical protein
MARWTLWLLILSQLLASCGGPRNYAANEAFQSDPRHQRNFQGPASSLCDAARRALLSDGYVVTRRDDRSILGGKEFQIEEKRHAILHLYVNCEQRAGGSVLFVTATEEHFDVKTIRNTSSIGFPLLAPIYSRTTNEADQPVKIQGETITEPDFYDRFYRAVQRELSSLP